MAALRVTFRYEKLCAFVHCKNKIKSKGEDGDKMTKNSQRTEAPGELQGCEPRWAPGETDWKLASDTWCPYTEEK